MISLNGITLPSGLKWTDEFASQSVAQTVKRTLAGGSFVQHGKLEGGRSITLEGDDRTGWIQRSQLEQLKALADTPGVVMTLVLRGTSYSVMFRHQDGNALTAEPLFPYPDPKAGDYFIPSIHLMTV